MSSVDRPTDPSLGKLSPGSLVLLDRDGVINVERSDYVRRASEWVALPGSLEAIARLSLSGARVVVVTNQSGLARGLFSETDLERVHRKMVEALRSIDGAIEGIFYCPHHPDANCPCRKPRPGLIHQAEQACGISAKGAPMVGDRLSDLEAAQAAGCRPILVRTGQGEAQVEEATRRGIPVFDSLSVAVDALLGG